MNGAMRVEGTADADVPRFDRRRLEPDLLARVLTLTSSLCAVNDALREPGPKHRTQLEARRSALLEELQRLGPT